MGRGGRSRGAARRRSWWQSQQRAIAWRAGQRTAQLGQTGPSWPGEACASGAARPGMLARKRHEPGHPVCPPSRQARERSGVTPRLERFSAQLLSRGSLLNTGCGSWSQAPTNTAHCPVRNPRSHLQFAVHSQQGDSTSAAGHPPRPVCACRHQRRAAWERSIKPRCASPSSTSSKAGSASSASTRASAGIHRFVSRSGVSSLSSQAATRPRNRVRSSRRPTASDKR